MNKALKYVIFAHLLSSSHLAFAAINPDAAIAPNIVLKLDKAGGLKRKDNVQIKTPKLIKDKDVTRDRYAALPKHFAAKNIKVSLDGTEINLTQITDAYKGVLLTKQELSKLSQEITLYFMNQDYLLPQVHFSKNKSDLQIEVKLASIDRVVFEEEQGNNALLGEYANKILATTPSRISVTQKYLGLMDMLPGYEIGYRLHKRSESVHGNVDLVIIPKKKKAAYYVGVDNYGIKDYGRYQGSMLAQVYSPFGYNESLLVQGSTTDHPSRLTSFGFGYSQPINANGTSINLSYLRSNSNATRATSIIGPDNFSDTYMTSLTQQLLVRARKKLQLEVSFRYRESEKYSTVRQAVIRSKKASYYSTGIGLKYSAKDSLRGNNLLHLRYIKGIGGKFKNYLNADDTADKYFNLVKFDFYREQSLPNDFSMYSHLDVNYSNDKLPSSQKSFVGGNDFGRAYEAGTLEGSKNIGFSVEGRYTKYLNNKFIGSVQPYVFYDIGYIRKKESGADVSNLQSAGLGVRFKMKCDIDFGIEAAEPFKKSYNVNGTNVKTKTKLGVYLNKSFEF